MSTATLNEVETEPAQPQLPSRLVFVEGLPPFQEATVFSLNLVDDAPPFLRMECESMDLAYILVDPFILQPDYLPDVAESDFKAVGLKNGERPLLMAIVNLRRGVENATMNLAGPILIHPRTGRAKQTVLLNAPKFSCRHRLAN
jgi:flagellar assembly factor FliW